jgi:hypothetical protein
VGYCRRRLSVQQGETGYCLRGIDIDMDPGKDMAINKNTNIAMNMDLYIDMDVNTEHGHGHSCFGQNSFPLIWIPRIENRKNV